VQALTYFQEHFATQEFIINLGDSVAGNKPAEEGRSDLDGVADAFSQLVIVAYKHHNPAAKNA